MKFALIIGVSCLCFYSLTGCAGPLMSVGKNQGWVKYSVEGDAKGVKQWRERDIDLINEARTPAGIKSSGYQLKEMRVKAWLNSMIGSEVMPMEVVENGK